MLPTFVKKLYDTSQEIVCNNRKIVVNCQYAYLEIGYRRKLQHLVIFGCLNSLEIIGRISRIGNKNPALDYIKNTHNLKPVKHYEKTMFIINRAISEGFF